MLNPVSPAAQSAILVYGIRSVLDLRLPAEVRRNPSPFAGHGNGSVSYHNIAFAGPIDSTLAEFGSLERQYELMIEAFAAVGSAVFSAIDQSTGGVLIQCEYGKDRTGLVCALLLELARVPRHVIAEDYAETAKCLAPIFEQFLASGPGDRTGRQADLARFTPRREVILNTLAILDAEFGGAESYLRYAGTSVSPLARVRDRVLTGP